MGFRRAVRAWGCETAMGLRRDGILSFSVHCVVLYFDMGVSRGLWDLDIFEYCDRTDRLLVIVERVCHGTFMV